MAAKAKPVAKSTAKPMPKGMPMPKVNPFTKGGGGKGMKGC